MHQIITSRLRKSPSPNVNRLRLVWAILLLALASLFVAPSVSAQSSESQPPIDHIGHRRHLHRHNPPHPEQVDLKRLVTSRQSPVELPLPLETPAFSFVVFGDRTGGPVEGVAVLADAVRDVNLLEPDLVMTVGDLIEGYNDTAAWMPQMREFKQIMDSLICPWFPVAGNHDIYWRGPGKPDGEHEKSYEMHFGPLWYAFQHKECWFVVLYSDEGNPKTGEKNINKPAAQVMSQEQLDWLKKTLSRAGSAEHVFVFLHHPRWLRDQYGDDWDKVHQALVAAGNVSAVFAGHIHRARYDSQDGIHYVTLATTGGHQSGTVPSVGYLHHFDIVTVRKNQIALASVPVGQVQDVREVTGAMQRECLSLFENAATVQGEVVVNNNGQSDGQLETVIRNTSTRPIEVTLTPGSDDSRWIVAPDHVHQVIPPGQSRRIDVMAQRRINSLDGQFKPLSVDVQMDYLAQGFRYRIPVRSISVPLKPDLLPPPIPQNETALALDGSHDFLAIDSGVASVADGPLTLECWFQAKSFEGRRGLLAKTENSEFGIFVSDGIPDFSVFLDSRYVVARDPNFKLKTGDWYHVAGVFDKRSVSIYVNGQRIASQPGKGPRRRNAWPLIIGADVDSGGNPTAFFDGTIDEVRLSSVARYSGDQFEPQRRWQPDDRTALLLHMDALVGPWLFDDSPRAAHVWPRGGARLGEVKTR